MNTRIIYTIFFGILAFNYGEKLLMVTREKYNSSCTSSEIYKPSLNCENSLEQMHENFNDWRVKCLNTYCLTKYIEITLIKPFDIVQMSIHQELIHQQELQDYVSITLGSNVKNHYNLNLYLTNILLIGDHGKDTKKIKINPGSGSKALNNVGLNHIIAYAYSNG